MPFKSIAFEYLTALLAKLEDDFSLPWHCYPCLPWTFNRHRKLKINGTDYWIQRISYIHAVGDIPSGHAVRSFCKDINCIRPIHHYVSPDNRVIERLPELLSALHALPPEDCQQWNRYPCLIWPYATAGHGYGVLSVHSHASYVHRLSYERILGPIPNGHYVLHHCDCPPCYRPSHLFTGTCKDNMRDAVVKGRIDYHNMPNKAQGENCHNAKLTPHTVRALRLRYQSGESPNMIARELGMAESSIYSMLTRRTWKSVV